MFLFIVGWNRPKVTSYGPVQEHTCPKCNNTQYWLLNKTSRYFTFFFIPIFAHRTDYFYFCPICRNAARLDPATFELYKPYAAINRAFFEKRITNEERIAKMQVLGQLEISVNKVR